MELEGKGHYIRRKRMEGIVISGRLAIEGSCFCWTLFCQNVDVDEVLIFKGTSMKFIVV